MEGLDLRNWFHDDEMEVCPRCGRDSALPTRARELRVCLDCGLVDSAGRRFGDRGSEADRARQSDLSLRAAYGQPDALERNL
jgi:transcription initiation factor TFIIIB Brf1 subunit/transcription initiation factor TFIIB